MKDKRIVIRVDEKEREDVDRAVKIAGIDSISAFFLWLLRGYLKGKK